LLGVKQLGRDGVMAGVTARKLSIERERAC
jgi:hypothetical protein